MNKSIVTMESLHDILQFDNRSMSLVSYRRKAVLDQEFLDESIKDCPIFAIGYLDTHRQYRLLESNLAAKIELQHTIDGVNQQLKTVYSDIGGYPVRVTCTVSAAMNDPMVRWNISIDNQADLEIVDVQYPFLVCSYDLNGTPDSESILLPHGYGSGKLIQNLKELESYSGAWKQKLTPDSWKVWELNASMGNGAHYPGLQFAQFMAYYNDRAGIYLACDDTEANVKRFAAVNRDSGIRLGISHIGDWPVSGERTLEYDIITTSFHGDWYDAADIYREWSFRQKWFQPLHSRTDIPQWLTDSPVYITIRPQGMLDAGPLTPMDDFIPYEKCIPLLDNVAAKVEAPLSVVLMGWERAGSWVYPDSFPPVGGEESMRTFISMMKERGWRAGTFSNGTRWVIGHAWSRYDGRDYMERHDGAAGVCRLADGSMWPENWDVDWRPSYTCCIGTQKTRDTAVNFVERIMGWGMESLQFLDQNNGAAAFLCFAHDHEHPPVPGKWMSEKLIRLIGEFKQAAVEAGETQVIHSAEGGLNETCLPLFQETELRTFPPDYGVNIIPLYQYLFHECVVLQGMMGNAPEPYHLAIRNAVNCVLGGIPGGVLTGDGTLLDKDTNNWGNWDPKVENSDHAFEMIRTVTALRRGPGKDFLVYGRMLRPANVTGIKTIHWTFNGRSNQLPAVFHSAWQAPDGRKGFVYANWTSETQRLRVNDERLQGTQRYITHASGQSLETIEMFGSDKGISITLEPLSCMLLEFNQ